MKEKATHIDYLHPRHLRVVPGINGNDAVCVAPSAKSYNTLYRKGLPRWNVLSS